MKNRLRNNYPLVIINMARIASMALILLCACKEERSTKPENQKQHLNHNSSQKYTCPMPEDSVFSDQPDDCPKCGMQLIKNSNHALTTISTNPQTVTIQPSTFNISSTTSNIQNSKFNVILSSISTIKPTMKTISIEIEVYGFVSYNPKNTYSIASKVAGRIDKLNLKYNFQPIKKGEKIMDIYSPELTTAQKELLYLQNADTVAGSTILAAAKQRLMLLGMTAKQIDLLLLTKQTTHLTSIYAPVDGHLHQMDNFQQNLASYASKSAGTMNAQDENTAFTIKEGMYVVKGQTLFNVIGTEKMWAILRIPPQAIGQVKVKQAVQLYSEMYPQQAINAQVDFIEPEQESGSTYLNARVYLQDSDHKQHKLKIGSYINAKITTGDKEGIYIPSSATIDLGNGNYAIFTKTKDGFKPIKITVGAKTDNQILVLSSLNPSTEIAINAQYLVDSEGFVNFE